MNNFSENKEKNNKKIKIFILIMLVVILIIFLFIYKKTNNNKKDSLSSSSFIDNSSSSSSESEKYPIGSSELLNEFLTEDYLEYEDMSRYINNLYSEINKKEVASLVDYCDLNGVNDNVYLNNSGIIIYDIEEFPNINSEEISCLKMIDSHIKNINDIFNGTISDFIIDYSELGSPTSLYLLKNNKEIYEYYLNANLSDNPLSLIYREKSNKKIIKLGFIPDFDTCECTYENNIVLKYLNDSSSYLLKNESNLDTYIVADFNDYYQGKTIVIYSNACGNTVSSNIYGIDIEKRLLIEDGEDDNNNYRVPKVKRYIDLNTKKEIIVKEYLKGYLGWVVISEDDQLYFLGDDIYNYGKIKEFLIDESLDDGNQIINSISIELVNGQKFSSNSN